MDDSKHFRIQSGEAQWSEFDGELLASATSDDGKAQRWTIFELFKTTSGRYVLHKVGRSVVYHAEDSRCTRQAELITAGELLARDDAENEQRHDFDLRGAEAVLSYMEESVERLPCMRCQPRDIYSEHTPLTTSILAERDRHSVVVSETPRGILDSLHGRDGNGTLFLTRVAERLVRKATEKDEDIRAAWEVQVL